jgi:LPXTG-site transpeptidase (sortase) family protein
VTALRRVLLALLALGLMAPLTVSIVKNYQLGQANAQTDKVALVEQERILSQVEVTALPTTVAPVSSTSVEVQTTTTVAPAQTTTVPVSTTSTIPNAIDPLLTDIGQALGILTIPKIGVKVAILEGDGNGSTKQLNTGSAVHIRGTRIFGQGNTVIMAHRTTYGHPFRNIDQLAAGDEITVEVAGKRYTYIVQAAGVPVLEADVPNEYRDFGDTRLTLYACHPVGSAKYRLVVAATLLNVETM